MAGPFASNIKALFRPFLTTALVGIMAYIFIELWSGMLGAEGNQLMVLFTETEVKDMLRYVIYSTVFSATTSVVWWYGDRALTPPHMK